MSPCHQPVAFKLWRAVCRFSLYDNVSPAGFGTVQIVAVSSREVLRIIYQTVFSGSKDDKEKLIFRGFKEVAKLL